MAKTDTHHGDIRKAEKDRNHSRGANELALGYLNPASLPEETYTDEAAMLEARGPVRDDTPDDDGDDDGGK